jgi:alkanesulfonate monooxygenase SsuD/methylene tetrahydromethanopterin reductase-like flavin-dependent oxidoreductase (luciferase family)
VRVGITLPQFREDAEAAIAVARRAEAAGIDGAFVFDHLWPLGRPDRPALHSAALLGALAAETEHLVLGTLVARVGLVPNAVLAHTLVTLHRMTGGRFVAGLGTGDHANRTENEAYGVPFTPAAHRIGLVADACRRLRVEGVRTWVGGLSRRVREVAAAEADGWNGWGLAVEDFVRLQPAGVEATWAGQVLVARDAAGLQDKLDRLGSRSGLAAGTVDGLAAHLGRLAAAGATWAVCAPLDVGTDPEVPDLVAEAAEAAGRVPPRR